LAGGARAAVALVGDRGIVSLQDWTSRGREDVRQDEGERKGQKMGGMVSSWRRNQRRTPLASAGSDEKSRWSGGKLSGEKEGDRRGDHEV
jgi:hypothetical protein